MTPEADGGLGARWRLSPMTSTCPPADLDADVAAELAGIGQRAGPIPVRRPRQHGRAATELRDHLGADRRARVGVRRQDNTVRASDRSRQGDRLIARTLDPEQLDTGHAVDARGEVASGCSTIQLRPHPVEHGSGVGGEQLTAEPAAVGQRALVQARCVGPGDPGPVLRPDQSGHRTVGDQDVADRSGAAVTQGDEANAVLPLAEGTAPTFPPRARRSPGPGR